MFVSEFFHFNEEQIEIMKTTGVFDALIDMDSNFFINIIRLKESIIPEFQEAYLHINNFFSDIATLLDNADSASMNDIMYRSARKKLCFHEVNGINLGFSKSGYGAGWGRELSDKFLADAYQIIKKGSKQPELFHLATLFEEDIGPDRLSDMIATIIEPQIVKYTLRIMSTLGITSDRYPELCFLENGLVNNPKKNTGILLLPTDILHKLPIAKDWNEIDRVIAENDFIRREISEEIGEQWKKWASSDKKRYLKERIFMDPDTCSRVIDGYRNQKMDKYDPKEDLDYLVQYLFSQIKRTNLFNNLKEYPSSLEATRAIIEIFKDWVENNRGWALIQDSPTSNREKAVQRLMHLGAKHYVESNNLDFSCESDEGRGPVDIKLSRGTDRTIAEIKLSTNEQYLHGYETQIIEYGKAERTRNLIYVFVDVGNHRRTEKLKAKYHDLIKIGQPCPELIIIYATPKKAASTYMGEYIDFEAIELPEINLDDFNIDEISEMELFDFDFSNDLNNKG